MQYFVHNSGNNIKTKTAEGCKAETTMYAMCSL